MKKKVKAIVSALTFGFLTCSLFATTTMVSFTAKAATDYADDTKWIASIDEPEDYAYSMAIVGDPQYMTQYDRMFGTNYLHQMYKWIADNVESKKIEHVAMMGDLTHNDVIAEWNIAASAISQLDGVVSYSLVRGNHDNRTTFYDQAFGQDGAAYLNQQTLVSCYEYDWVDPNDTTKVLSADARNTAHEFSGTNTDYLLVALDFGAQDDVLEWANSVVESYPNHTVIVTTHAYLDKNGVILDGTSGVSPNGNAYDGPEGQYHGGTGNNQSSRLWEGKQWKYQAKSLIDEDFNDGDDIWDKFVSKHENISMVFCGHVENVDIKSSTRIGDNGNTVHEFVINPQNIDDDGFYREGGSPAKVGTDDTFTGMVAIHYFSEDGKHVDVQWYSTIKDQFYNEINQYSFEPATTERGAPYVKVMTYGGGSATPTYAALEGQPIEICFTPDKYYRLGTLKLNGVDITEQLDGNIYRLQATEGYYNLKATFVEEVRYAFLEQNDLSKGNLTYSLTEPDATFRAGDTFTVKVTPVEGCSVKRVVLNGTSLTADGEGNYTITILAQDNVLVVEYDGEPVKSPTEENPPDSSEDPPTSSDNGSTSEDGGGSGCNSSIIGLSGIGVALAVVAIGIVAIKRKKE